ncbi:MAG TPA: ABC transporter permease subunit [Longimicrobiales bacterium]
MTLREIFRFEFLYQLRRVSTWLDFAVMVVVPVFAIRGTYIDSARIDGHFLNAPFVIASVTAVASLIWLLVGAGVAGGAAARDVRTGMHPLTYTAPIRKTDYLGGRFLAALALNASILLAVPAGILLAVATSGVEPEFLGPFRPAAYLTAYAVVALPNAFIATAIQFSLAVLGRRAMASHFGGLLLLIASAVVADWEAGRLLDPLGIIAMDGVMSGLPPIERNTALIGLDGSLLLNRVLWLGIALGVLAFTHLRFRFAHPAAGAWWSRIGRRRGAHAAPPAGAAIARGAIAVPHARRTFGFATCARQTLAIAWTSFRAIVTRRGGLIFIGLFAVVMTLLGPAILSHMGVPLLPRTEHVIHTFLASSLMNFQAPFEAPPLNFIFFFIPLLTIIYAGELVWREREAGVSEIADATPVPEWVSFVGKFLGLGLVLAAWLAILMAAGMVSQARMGYHDFEIGLYARVLFGIQLVEYLLLALLALVVHVIVDQRHVAHLATVLAFGCIVAAPAFGIEHNLLVYGAGPAWSYTEMRGFGPSLGPWLWFKLYWAAWALLLAVAARLLWVRGRDGGLRARLRQARRRFDRATAGVAAAAAGLILVLGGFIFYNTNVLNAFSTASRVEALRAEYERRYGRYEGIPQPRVAGTNLHVEIYPERGAVDIRGSYRLVNRGAVPIDSIHVATVPGVETGVVPADPRAATAIAGEDLADRSARAVDRPADLALADGDRGRRIALAVDRPARLVLEDAELGHHIYALEQPLRPGDSLRLVFEVHVEPRGFGNDGVGAAVVANGTYFTNEDWLPAIGYQPGRELTSPSARREQGLAPRPLIPSLYDVKARQVAAERIDFEAIVGTSEDQVAVAPGVLRRTWTEGGRRYFHYSTDAPIGSQFAIFSADYAVHEGRWNDPASGSGEGIAIQIYHHPEHTANLDRMLRSVRASLEYYGEQFGPYPYSQIRLVEHPGHGLGMHAEATTIDYQEGFSLLNPEDDPRGFDLPFAVVAHEVAHQWWGTQLAYAPVEGAGLLSESLAWYSAMGVVEHTYGPEQLHRLLSRMRVVDEAAFIARKRGAPPLLRAGGWFQNYRQGPFALYALREYIGEERVNTALRRLLEAHRSGAPPRPTTLDLYRELQAVTPDSLRYLLHDLFEANTWWEFATERATAEQTEAGTWRVTLGVRARKVVVDTTGVATEVPMDDWVQVGVFAPAEEGEGGEAPGEPLYLRLHRVRSGEQTITVTVPREPARAGIDPYHLLIDLEMADNIGEVETAGPRLSRSVAMP